MSRRVAEPDRRPRRRCRSTSRSAVEHEPQAVRDRPHRCSRRRWSPCPPRRCRPSRRRSRSTTPGSSRSRLPVLSVPPVERFPSRRRCPPRRRSVRRSRGSGHLPGAVSTVSTVGSRRRDGEVDRVVGGHRLDAGAGRRPASLSTVTSEMKRVVKAPLLDETKLDRRLPLAARRGRRARNELVRVAAVGEGRRRQRLRADHRRGGKHDRARKQPEPSRPAAFPSSSWRRLSPLLGRRAARARPMKTPWRGASGIPHRDHDPSRKTACRVEPPTGS